MAGVTSPLRLPSMTDVPGPIPTLGELQQGTPWVWAYREGRSPAGKPCMHHAPLAIAPFVIRWSANASSDMMRERLRCAICGHCGAHLQHPSWVGKEVGFQPFPKS